MNRHSKIALRLLCYFSAALLLFSVVVGSSFALLSYRQTMDLNRRELQRKAESVATTVSGFLSGTAQTARGGHHGGQSQEHGEGFGSYMRYVSVLTGADVWVVDSDSKTITPCSSHHTVSVQYGELPADGETVIDRALEGDTCFSESFSGVLGERTLSVGVPIRQEGSSAILGAVLLHTPVQGITDTVWKGWETLLFCVLAALLAAFLMSYLLSLKFTRPLERMRLTAERIAEGDFTAKNGLAQKDEIGDLAADMDRMADRLAEAAAESARQEQARRDFMSNISHELRTPVTVLRGSLEALVDGVVDDPAQVEEYQRQMLAESKNLQRLVDDLLELSRLQNVDFKIEKAPLELRQLLEDVARSMRRVAEPKGVRLETSFDEGSFPFVGDYGRLRQMVVVVLENAVKFSPAGESVTLSLARQEDNPVVSVTDHGPGFPQERAEKIFQRFQSGGKDNKTGTGLGLPIAREIAQRHGIVIQPESKPGRTEFRFVFPQTPPVESGQNRQNYN